jgi:rod shape-determining protein MreC
MLRQPSGGLSRVAVPVKALLDRFGLLILALLSVTLMVVGKVEPQAANQIRVVVVTVASPLLDALSRPVESVNRMVQEGASFFALREENRQLLEAVERGKRWELSARQLEQENALLRTLLNYKLEPRPAFVSARVIGDSGSAYVRTLLVNAGAADGVAQGQAAVTGDGLVGRVVEVGRRAARILLVTDLNSRIPVIVEDTRQPAVLAGDNGPTATLAFLPRDAEVEVGARIITSGHGSVLPPGLPVGVVTSVVGALVRVQPIADLGRVEYVRLVDWQAPVFEPLAPVEMVGEPAPGVEAEMLSAAPAPNDGTLATEGAAATAALAAEPAVETPVEADPDPAR